MRLRLIPHLITTGEFPLARSFPAAQGEFGFISTSLVDEVPGTDATPKRTHKSGSTRHEPLSELLVSPFVDPKILPCKISYIT